MDQTFFMKFYAFIEHSEPNNVTISAIPEKFPGGKKKCFL